MKNRTSLSLLIVLLPAIYTACMKIDVEPPSMDGAGRSITANNKLPLVLVRVLGDRAHRKDWARARSMYRAFVSGVTNKSGSLSDLTSPGIRSILGGAGLTARFADPKTSKKDAGESPGKHAYLLIVEFKKADLVWQPPREFIQTPTARRRGHIDLDFHITFDLYAGAVFARPKTEALLRHECREKNRRKVLPGTQEEFMGTLAHRVLAACLRDFRQRLIAARDRLQ